MEEKSNQLANVIQNIENKNNLELKTKKKIKGYCRFLRNVIKEKSKSLKEIMQNRFIKWRKDALKGKIKKTVMIRISVSREKDPKTKYQISKANPKDQSKSVNKNDLKSFDINNIQRNITNLKVQKVDELIKEDNKINNNKVNSDNKYNNIEIKTISNINPNKDKKEKEDKNIIYKKTNVNNKNEEQKNNHVIKIDLSKYDKNNINNNNNSKKIINKNEKPIVIARTNKLNKENIQKIPKPNQVNIRNNPQDKIKNPISNISNTNIVYTSSVKKINPYEIKNKNENNRTTKNYQTDIKEKIPKTVFRKYEVNKQYNSKPANDIKVDLTKGNYTRQTFNKHNKDNSYTNLSYDINKLQNKNLYNNSTYQGKNNNKNNNNNNSNYNYNIKTDINNNHNSSSINSGSRKGSNITSDKFSFRKNTKGGVTTVIQHYSGQSRKYDNYDYNTYDVNKNKK